MKKRLNWWTRFTNRISQSVRWQLGLRVAAPELEAGDDASITSFYNSRVTDCGFLSDPAHYEYPRAKWVLDRVQGGTLLEIGCGNGGMTRLLASRVDRVVALDISEPSLEELKRLGLKNVETVRTLVEHYQPDHLFDWIVMSEVLEHVRRPEQVVCRCFEWLAPGGTLLITTPHGHWESNEHLHEFDLSTFCRILTATNAEVIKLGYLRDSGNRRRWLVGEITAPVNLPTPLPNRRQIIKERRRRSAVWA
jgi:SAM-dependent methyltransferase